MTDTGGKMNDRKVLTAAPPREEPAGMQSPSRTRRFFVAARERLFRMFMARAGLAIPSPGMPGKAVPRTRPSTK